MMIEMVLLCMNEEDSEGGAIAPTCSQFSFSFSFLGGWSVVGEGQPQAWYMALVFLKISIFQTFFLKIFFYIFLKSCS